jgi:hypothetical protein
MKIQTIKKLFAFIITIVMFSFMPALVNAQRCGDWMGGGCRKGYICLYGYCVKFHGGGNGNGLVNETTLTNIYFSGSQAAAISFSLDKLEKISAKIFDMTGQLVKTLADKIFEQGEHKLL